MTINEKTRLLPKDYQKSYVIPIPQEDLNNNSNNNNNIDGSDYDYGSYALTKAELTSYIDDPFWIRVRYICFSIYWVFCLVALVTSCYIAVSALKSGTCTSPLNAEINNSFVSPTLAPLQTTDPIISATDDGSTITFRLLSQQA